VTWFPIVGLVEVIRELQLVAIWIEEVDGIVGGAPWNRCTEGNPQVLEAFQRQFELLRRNHKSGVRPSVLDQRSRADSVSSLDETE
jgi:hypothetical protein